MIVRIDLGSNIDVLQNENGVIIAKVNYFSEFTSVATVSTIKGETVEDMRKNKTHKQKGVFVSTKGNISTETYK